MPFKEETLVAAKEVVKPLSHMVARYLKTVAPEYYYCVVVLKYEEGQGLVTAVASNQKDPKTLGSLLEILGAKILTSPEEMVVPDEKEG